jgi:single-strand DNA-binding protein
MKGVNKAIIIGSVGKDPDMRSTADGTQIANLSVATSESYKDKSGNKVENTEWHRVSAFGKLAEIIGQYVTKGSKVYIEGKIRTRSYDKDGQKVYTTEIIANELQMLGGNEAPKPASKPASKPSAATDFDDSLDSIPF